MPCGGKTLHSRSPVRRPIIPFMNEIDRRKKIAGLGLTAQEKRFCEEYVKDFDGPRARKDAGYRGNRTHEELLAREGMQEYVDLLCDEITERLKLSADAILNELKVIAFSNIKDFVSWTKSSITVKPLKEMDPALLPAISEISDTANGIKLKLHNKLDALERLHKYVAAKPKKVAQKGVFNIKNALISLGDGKTRNALEHLAMKELNESSVQGDGEDDTD